MYVLHCKYEHGYEHCYDNCSRDVNIPWVTINQITDDSCEEYIDEKKKHYSLQNNKQLLDKTNTIMGRAAPDEDKTKLSDIFKTFAVF